MTSATVNLVPAARLHARRRLRHVRRCAAGCFVYAGAALAAALACRGVWGRPDASLPARLSEAAAANERVARDVASAKADLDGALATLRASRSIAGQPDWSLLMQLLASRQGEEVLLRECRVQPRDFGQPPQPAPAAPAPGAKAGPKAPAAQAPPVPSEPSMLLAISGLGRSQPAVSQFVLRLEGLHLFAKVTLLETSRETYLGGEAVAFRIECSLDDPAAPSANATSATNTAHNVNTGAQPGGSRR